MTTGTVSRYLLKRRPVGVPTADDFDFVNTPFEPLAAGEIRVANRYVSIDPAMRGWMTAMPSYLPPVELGAVMRAFGVGEVIESRHDAWPVGSLVSGMLGVQSHFVSSGKGLSPIQQQGIPLSAFVGPMGVPGLSAYFGLLEVGQPKPGQTVLVSGAAGAVGSIVGQIARIKGCRVVGIAGGPDKCRHLVDELGFDAAIDYKNQSVKKAIRETCPDGIDVYFDNVGGEILNAALTRLAMGARVVICGAISQYNATSLPPGPSNYLALLIRRARMEGFIVIDFMHRAPEAIGQLTKWIAAGDIKYRETLVDGLELFPETFLRLFSGEKLGKLALRL